MTILSVQDKKSSHWKCEVSLFKPLKIQANDIPSFVFVSFNMILKFLFQSKHSFSCLLMRLYTPEPDLYGGTDLCLKSGFTDHQQYDLGQVKLPLSGLVTSSVIGVNDSTTFAKILLIVQIMCGIKTEPDTRSLLSNMFL